jgi:hypothetical protein
MYSNMQTPTHNLLSASLAEIALNESMIEHASASTHTAAVFKNACKMLSTVTTTDAIHIQNCIKAS